jgi:hypothetical protein
MMTNTRRIGPLEIGTKPYRHWRLTLPSGIKIMSTPLALGIYRVAGDGVNLRRLPFTRRQWKTYWR